MRTPFPRKRGGGGHATGGSGGHATGGGGGGTTGRCEGLRSAETGRRANLGWAQTGERPERGGEEGGGPHTVAHRRGGKRNRSIGVNCHVGSFLSAFCVVPSPQRAPPSPLLPPTFRVSPLSRLPLSHCPFPGAPHLCTPLPSCPRVPCPHMTALPVCRTSPSLDPPFSAHHRPIS